MPLSIGAFLFAGGLFFLYRNQIAYARRLILFALAWLFLFSYSPVANLLLSGLENRYPPLLQPPHDIAYIYVLGYAHKTDDTLPLTSQLDKEAVVRLCEGIRLYHALKGRAKLIVSGYSGLFDTTPHATMQKRLALSLGIPQKDIVTVPNAKDTQEESLAAEKVATGSKVAVVSSAYHLPRAMKFFNARNITAIPAPTYHQAHTVQPDYLGIFSADALKKSTVVFHEYLGMLWQKIKGV